MAKLLNRLKQRYTTLLVEHDMDIVFALADRITVLVYGKVLVCGTSHVVRNHPDVKTAYLGDQEDGL
jgi:branched-chain amino acid transport system ATP-binding protein